MITSEAITLFFDGGKNPQTVTKHSIHYRVIREALEAGTHSEQDIKSLFKTRNAVKQYSDGLVDIRTDGVYYAGTKLDNSVTRRMVSFLQDDIPIEPLVEFLKKLQLNPSHRSVSTLYDFLEREGLTLAPDGDFLAYKAVTRQLRDKWTRTICNAPGFRPTMPRNEVCDNPNNGCAPGLHMGSHDYATGYASGDDVVIITKCSPANVVCVPVDCGYQKIRTCGYEVVCRYTGKLPIYSYDLRNPYAPKKKVIVEDEWSKY